MFGMGTRKQLDVLQLKIFNTVDVKSSEINTLQKFWAIPNFTVVNVTKYINESQQGLYKFIEEQIGVKSRVG